MHFFCQVGNGLRESYVKFQTKEVKKKVFAAKKTIFWIFYYILTFWGQKIFPIIEKGGVSWHVRMDIVLGNLHAKFGAHSSSGLFIIAAQTEICQKVPFFVIF